MVWRTMRRRGPAAASDTCRMPPDTAATARIRALFRMSSPSLSGRGGKRRRKLATRRKDRMTPFRPMDPARWQQIERLYHEAQARAAGERGAFLADACAGDEALRHEVQALLDSPATAEGFLSGAAF